MARLGKEKISSRSTLWTDETEVVVVGCGTGGAPAAIEAARAGASVLVIEKMDWLGGCMRRCGGGVIGCNTKVQRKLGIQDRPDLLFEYMAACCEGNYDEDLLRVFCDNCGLDFDWIITPREEGGLGGQPLEEWEFATSDNGLTGLVTPGLNIGGPAPMYYEKFGLSENNRQRCHWFKPNPHDIDPGDRKYATYSSGDFGAGHGSRGGGGTGLWKLFEDELRNLDNIRIEMNTTIREILMNDKGEAIGISVASTQYGETRNIKATKGVVIATGSFVMNKELYENFVDRPWFANKNARSVVNGSPYNEYQADGAGIKALLKCGVAPRYLFEGNSGGLRINTNAQAINTDGQVIPRLYISSRAVGGLSKEAHYPQCGAFVSSALCFGRIAGRHAAALRNRE